MNSFHAPLAELALTSKEQSASLLTIAFFSTIGDVPSFSGQLFPVKCKKKHEPYY
ncbi:hypothetical protein DB29_00759 [Shouchella clausii]|nr:hypothetical protein DB29_00759 [Shouchella clausii]